MDDPRLLMKAFRNIAEAQGGVSELSRRAMNTAHAEIEKLTELPKFVRIMAEHSGQLVNYSRLGSGIGVSHKTGQRYVGLLEQLFLVAILQPWYTNALKRIVRTPKLHFLDCGLLASATAARTASMRKLSRSVATPEILLWWAGS